MAWQPVVVGVDNSPAALGAVGLAQRLAVAAGTECRLVHAVRDQWAPFAAVGEVARVQEMQRLQLAVARQQINDVFHGRIGSELLQTMEVRFGPAAAVVARVAEEHDAGMIVLGGKHHSLLERWLGGSTSLHVVRSATIPVLVTAGTPTGIRRILVAADLSEAARPTLAMADRIAEVTGAQIRAISVFEPLPVLTGTPPVDPAEYYGLSQELLQRDIWPLIRTAGAEKLVRHGMVVETLLREAADWPADLLVVGSHGKGWAQRVLLGSVTERLLNDLPTSLLIAPVGVAATAEAVSAEVVGV